MPVVSTVTLWLGTAIAGGSGADTGRLGALGALVGGRHDLGRQVQVRTQVLCALVCEVPKKGERAGQLMLSKSRSGNPHLPVIVAPGKLFLDEAARLQGLHGLDDVQVGHGLQLRMLRSVGVLLGHHDALLEEELIDGNAMLLGHKHPAMDKEYVITLEGGFAQHGSQNSQSSADYVRYNQKIRGPEFECLKNTFPVRFSHNFSHILVYAGVSGVFAQKYPW